MVRAARRLAFVAAALCAPAAAQQAAPVRHATGTFEVAIAPEASAPAPTGGLPTARMGLT